LVRRQRHARVVRGRRGGAHADAAHRGRRRQAQVRRDPARRPVREPSDLRSASITATPAGRRSDERIKALRAEVVSAATDRLSPAQQQAVLAALPALEALRTELAAAVQVKDGARDSAGA
jgi:hypothetical protein